MKKFYSFLIIAIFTVSFANAQVLFSDDFDDGNGSSRWSEASVGGVNTSDFAFDYIGAGLPAAPNGGGLGLKMEVNVDPDNPATSQIYEFPAGQTFTGNYTVSFDLWTDYEDGGSGTTQFIVGGVMHSDESLPSVNGIDFAFTCDWGSGHDLWCWYEGLGVGTSADPTIDTIGYYTGVDIDGLESQNGNGTALYESAFVDGIPGWQWNHVIISVDADSVAWYVNDIMFAKVFRLDYDGNASLGLYDMFSSVGTANFTVFDNFMVKSGALSVNDIKSSETAKLYPVPATDVLNIIVNETSTFELINTVGQTVRSSMVEGKSTIGISNLSPGIYLARITSKNGQVEIHKILIK